MQFPRLLFLAALFLAANVGIATACGVVESPFEDGSSAIYAISFDAKTGSSIEIGLGNRTDCYISAFVEAPTSVTVALHALSPELPQADWRIRLVLRVFSSDTPVVLDERPVAEPQTFNLISGRYDFVLHVAGPSAPATRPAAPHNTRRPAAATHRFVVISREATPLSPLEPVSDSRKTFKLDRYSGTADFAFNLGKLGRRVEFAIVLDMSQWPEAGRDSVRVSIRDEQSRGYDEEYRTTTPEGFRKFHYIVPARMFRLTVSQSQENWPRKPLTDRQANAELTIRVPVVEPVETPAALTNLDRWLSDIGISDRFEVLEFYDREQDAVRSPAELRQRYDRILESVESYRARRKPDDPDIWHGEAKPRYVVRMRVHGSREEIGDVEQKFRLQGNVSLWDRVLRKISLSANIPSRRIVIDVPVYCSGSVAFELAPGRVERYGNVCMSASAPVDFAKLGAGTIGLAAVGNMNKSLDLPDAVVKFMAAFFPSPEVSIQYLAKDSSFVDMIVRGIRGHVIKGGAEWEKIQISVVKSGETEVRFLADGLLASGVGGYPPDSQFTKSIEPGNAQDLTTYTKALATAFGDYLVKGRK